MNEQGSSGPDTPKQTFYAHTDPGNPGLLPENGGKWHLLKDHLEETAHSAKQFASAFGAGDWGYLAGLLHDLGKYFLINTTRA